MAETHFITFSTPNFTGYQNDLIRAAKSYGIKNFFTHNSSQLKQTLFFRQNTEIFSFSRGFGYWLWKPYLILEALKKIEEGDILFYADSGCALLADPAPLISICTNNHSGIVAFNTAPLKNLQWCKRDAFIITGCDDVSYWNANHVIATTILLRKSQRVTAFVEEWLRYCKNPNCLTELPNVYGEDLPGFVKHMGDQPVFSLLIEKYKIETYRNPSKWGNFLKSPPYREMGEFIGTPYSFDTSITSYSRIPCNNSPYKTIFFFNRLQLAPRKSLPILLKHHLKQAIKKFLNG